MKKFILSDLHIGHKEAQYSVMDQAITYIRQEARAGDETWGLGDWFHMYENGFENCLRHPMTQKFRDLAGQIPTKLLPGNHDHALEKYRDNPGLGSTAECVVAVTHDRIFLTGPERLHLLLLKAE